MRRFSPIGLAVGAALAVTAAVAAAGAMAAADAMAAATLRRPSPDSERTTLAPAGRRLSEPAAGGATLAQVLPPGPDPGDFLIASRDLDDPNFARTVVLLLQAGPDGAGGVVVNRPTLTPVATVLPQVEGLSERTDRLFWGGPVEPHAALVLVRVDQAPAEGSLVLDGVYAVRTRAGIEQILGGGLPQPSLRVFTGHAGWAAGQLEWEISRGSWHLRRADADRIFAEEVESLWDRLSRLALSPIA
ncbi:MAG TPA: YqgE/AlgH family protein [Thermoanaerobaculia bacterium]|nr:YqgE/AlgH family protein [Thermoanaerobaculia bacterium]